MEQQDNGYYWNTLPSVIMLEIFSYLEHKDRINASMVCKNWRQALFHPAFWKDITFVLDDTKNSLWSSYLGDCFGLSVQNATVRCQIPHCSLELEKLLRNLCENRNLRRLFVEPSTSTFEWSFTCYDDMEALETWTESLYLSIIKIIETSKRLEALTLGCVEELVLNAGEVLEMLGYYHGKHLTHLGLASVKEDPENYQFVILNSITFQQFISLTILTLDYDYLNDTMLGSLTSGTLERLVVHVHNWKENYTGTSDDAWELFTQKNPRCELRLNLLHAYTGVTVLERQILKRNMPLTHFKALFCEYVNLGALYTIASYYSTSLKSLMWIDSADNNELSLPPTDGNPDGLVMVAWRCVNLQEIVYIGHKYYHTNLLAIARLRGHTLRRFEFAENDIKEEDTPHYKYKEVRSEINSILGGNWKTFSDSELMPVLIDAIAGDSRDVIMPLVLSDAK
ncbi:F-box only protein 33 [Microplitis mediator]|uniref:F-box only protein 33 n=1 Tax=Microplitis mediator TaxID=375433 RepID=UPI002556B4EC|nr:F-box only protein 33 [Microplitis mediator]